MTHAAKVVPVQVQFLSRTSIQDRGKFSGTRPPGKNLPIPTEKEARWAHSRYGRLGILKNLWPLTEIEPWFLGRTFLRLVKTPTNKPKLDSCYAYYAR